MKSIALVFLLLLAHLSHAQLYKWVDENGQTHYSERRPNNTEVTTIKEQKHTVSKPYAPSRIDTQKAILDQAASTKEKKLDAEKEAKYQKQRSTYCNAQKKRLASLNTGKRIRIQNKDGEYVYADDKQRQSQIADAKKGMAEHCQ